MALPSYINPLLPILIIFSSISLNYKFIYSNENLIIKQYLNEKDFKKLASIFFIIILSIFILNKEILAPKAYEHYKKNELEIRNNLKLGYSGENEFHIGNELSLFFESSKKNNFKNVKAIIYQQSRFIISNEATLEFDDQNFNIIFYNGERVILNEVEKSFTSFEKFTYSIKKQKVEKLFYDKDHFNTIELINNNEKEFSTYGHNQVYQYFFIIIVILISQKIIFFRNVDKGLYKNYFNLILIILTLVTINSFLQYLLNNDYISIFLYYLINLIGLLFLKFYSYFKYADK